MKNRQEVLLPEWLSTVERHCPTDGRINGVVEFEVLGQNVNDLYKIRPGKVQEDQLSLRRSRLRPKRTGGRRLLLRFYLPVGKANSRAGLRQMVSDCNRIEARDVRY